MTEDEAKKYIENQLDNSTGNYDEDDCDGAIADCGGVHCMQCLLHGVDNRFDCLTKHYPHLVPELRPGDIIKTKAGKWYQILDRNLWQALYIKQSGNTLQVTITSVLHAGVIKDIVKDMTEIYRGLEGAFCFEQMVCDGKFKVWERPETVTKEVTIAELEKELGYKIKIVKEK